MGEALMNAGKASAEYKSTIADLQKFQHTLERIQSLQDTHREDVVLKHYAKQCCRPIAEFLDKIREYEAALVPGKDQKRSTRAILRRVPKQVKWAILVQEDVAKVRNEVGAPLAVINAHLALPPRQNMIKTERTVSFNSHSAEHVENASDVLVRREKDNPSQETTAAVARHIDSPPLLTITSKSFSLTVGPDALAKPEKTLEILVAIFIWISLPGTHRHIWHLMVSLFFAMRFLPRSPTMLLDSNVLLTDALGRSLSLSIDECRDWSALLARLRILFQGCPGQQRLSHYGFGLMVLDKG